MTAVRLTPRQQICVEGRIFKVLHRDGNENWVLEEVQSLAPKSLSDSEVGSLFSKGLLTFVHPDAYAKGGLDPNIADFSLLADNLREEAYRRRDYVRVVEVEGVPLSTRHLAPVIAKTAAALGDENPPSPSTLCRWLNLWYEGGASDIRALVPSSKKRGNRRQRFPYEVLNIVNEAIEDLYMRPERTTQKTVWSKVVTNIDRLNQRRSSYDQLPVPSERMIGRRIASLNKRDVLRARKGKAVADQTYRNVDSGPKVTRPLERVEIDHTKLDIILVTNEGVPLERPWLTAVIDCYSRALVGFHVTLNEPSMMSVGSALRHAILPKEDVRARYPAIRNEWPCYGIPESAVVDNGSDFQSGAFDDACAQLGINHQFCPVGEPRFKGKVERFFGTVATDLCHQIQGTTFSNVRQRGDYQSAKAATLTFDEFHEAFHRWVVDCYMQDIHGGTGETPIHLWERGTRDYPVRLPNSLSDLDPLLGGRAVRKLTRLGVKLQGLHYNSDEICRLRSRPDCPKRVTVRFDPSDISSIWVHDPLTGIHIRTPSLDPEYTSGLSMDEHMSVQKLAREKVKGRLSVADLCRSRDELRRFIDESVSKNRKRKRARTVAGRSAAADVSRLRLNEPVLEGGASMGVAPAALGGNQSSKLARSGRDGEAVISEWEDDDDVIDPESMGIRIVPRA